MKTCNLWPIGVCSWSVSRDNLDEIAQVLAELGLGHVHLSLWPMFDTAGQDYLKRIGDYGWKITATMIGFAHEDYSTIETIQRSGGIVPQEHWQEDREKILKCITATAQLKVPYLTFHAGFIDHADPAGYHLLIRKIRELADEAARQGIMLLMETGQETAADLRKFLQDLDHPAVGVNFDPANMILYSKGTPAEAVGALAPWIRHVHIKDANPPAQSGQWGEEVAWSTGAVNQQKFLNALRAINYTGALAIEREAGATRRADIAQAVEKLTAMK